MKKLITQEVTPNISHAIFVSNLMRRCADEIAESLKYVAEIDNFGRLMCPFQHDLSLCVSVSHASITFMATISGDHTPVMLKLIQAGFEIGEATELHSHYKKKQSWKAPVQGLNVDFILYFQTTVDTSEAL